MARGRRDGLLIAGGGIAGCLAALAIARFRPEIDLLIVEESEQFGGDGHHLFFDDEIVPEARPLLEPLIEHQWPGYYVAFPGFSRKLKAGCSAFGPDAVHRQMLASLKPGQYRLGTKVVAVREDALVLDGGETVKAEGAIDARGAANQSLLELLYETRVERAYRTARPHGVDRPVLVDATVDGAAGLRFVQVMPLDPDRLLLAEASISDRVQPDPQAADRLDDYVALRGWKGATGEAVHSATRPLPFGGDFDAFWRIGGARVARLGLRGGLLHPLTGRTVADAAGAAMLLTRQPGFDGPQLHDVVEDEAKRLWRQREALRALVGGIASAAPEARLGLLQRMFRLDPALLARVIAGRLSLLDRGRVQRAMRDT
jgi:lycopene beta-cyclase